MEYLTQKEYAVLRENYTLMKQMLQSIVDKHDMRTELYFTDEQCADNLRDTAEFTLNHLQELPDSLF